jgi:hypothetical protein
MHDIIQKEYQIIIIENRPGYVLKLKGKDTCPISHPSRK